MRILFQGDSITDARRIRDEDDNLGFGYPTLVQSQLGFEYPGEYEFFNRGMGGDRITDIYARIKRDILNLKPDVLSILVGVNDVWHDQSETSPCGVCAEKYFKIYKMLIEEIQESLPNIKIMIMEPFVLPGSVTEDKWEIFETEVAKRAEMARKIADTFQLSFVELQKGFLAFAQTAPASYWLRDGVHPTAMGHQYIKNEWIKTFRKMLLL